MADPKKPDGGPAFPSHGSMGEVAHEDHAESEAGMKPCQHRGFVVAYPYYRCFRCGALFTRSMS